MTEAEWLSCTEPEVLLNYIRHRTTQRKLRLFACACCRCVEHLLDDERSRQAVLVVEQHADGLASDAELNRASILAGEAAGEAATSGNTLAMLATAVVDYALFPLNDSSVLSQVCEFTTRTLEGAALQAAGATPEMLETWAGEDAQPELNGSRVDAVLCELIQDIFGNPYRPVEIEPAWLTPTVQEMAQFVYDEQEFARLPVLADALEDGGCTSTDLLKHGRQAGSHVRGCWLVDALLRPAGQASQKPDRGEQTR